MNLLKDKFEPGAHINFAGAQDHGTQIWTFFDQILFCSFLHVCEPGNLSLRKKRWISRQEYEVAYTILLLTDWIELLCHVPSGFECLGYLNFWAQFVQLLVLNWCEGKQREKSIHLLDLFVSFTLGLCFHVLLAISIEPILANLTTYASESLTLPETANHVKHSCAIVKLLFWNLKGISTVILHKLKRRYFS